MQIKENHPLKAFNTFGIDVKARYFAQVETDHELMGFVKDGFWRNKELLIINGGSNILFTKDFDGIVVKISTQGVAFNDENDGTVLAKAQAGENWHNFVSSCIGQNLAGLENLSMIPGNTGAAPIQNIGAYGVEQKDTFESLEALELDTCKVKTLTKSDCKFGYRNSVFKQELKNRFIILSVTYRLSRKPVFRLGYGDLQKELSGISAGSLTIRQVSDAVCRIRRNKLPDPEKVGNAGSFFKNPTITRDKYDQLQQKYPGLPGYASEGGEFKIAAGWMIDYLGWKGFRHGDAGVCATQALVLVNYGNANGAEILELAIKIQDSVRREFGIPLEPEVNIY